MFNVFDDPLGFKEEQDVHPDVVNAFNHIMDIAAVFNTEQGKRVLKMWRENTIEQAAWSPSLARQSGMEQANAHAYAREGQNAFIRDIEEKIKLAQTIKEPKDLLKGN